MRFRYFYRALINLFRLPLLCVFSKGKVDYKLIQFISPGATIINQGILKIGSQTMVESGALLKVSAGKIIIGDKVFINKNTIVVSHEVIEIGDNTTIGPNVCIYDHDHDFRSVDKIFIKESVFIGQNVWIGANVLILKGVTIGDNSVIGAGSIITKNIAANTLVYQKRENVTVSIGEKLNEKKNRDSIT